jgi:hypothetical protein
MYTPPKYSMLLQVNTRVWLTELSSQLKRRATLDDIPDRAIDEFAANGFDWIWFLSVWQTGTAAQAISRANPTWRREFEATLSDLKEEDIAGSGFAIQDYTVHRDLGGDAALGRIRQRMRQRGLKLMLDFVPNHFAPDHAWVTEHPDWFIQGTEDDIARYPQNYCRFHSQNGPLVMAYGRDPFFDGWPDTLQLNYGNQEMQLAMVGELMRIAGQCDGVRCDMAMLLLPDVFERTWGIRNEPFWPTAMDAIRETHPAFTFLGEVYWNLEWTMQQQGFDSTYDKTLYDWLKAHQAGSVREHLAAEMDYQNKLTRFLENHDEQRASAAFDKNVHKAAAIITFLSPGMRFFHQGQIEGRQHRISPHLVRGPVEEVDEHLNAFYGRLLCVLGNNVVRNGIWRTLECVSVWEDNQTYAGFIGFEWSLPDGDRLIVVANYSPLQSQCYLKLPGIDLSQNQWQLIDLMNDITYVRDGKELMCDGLFLDAQPWQYHVFRLETYIDTTSVTSN